MKVGNRGRGTFPFWTCLKSWDTVSIAMGRGLRVQTERCAKAGPVGGVTGTPIHGGAVPTMRALRSILRWRTTSWWWNRIAWGLEKGPDERDTMEAQIRIPQQRSAGGCSDVEVGGRREGLDTAYGTRTAPQGGCDDQSASDDEAADGDEKEETERLGDLVLEKPAEDRKLTLDIGVRAKQLLTGSMVMPS